MQFRRSVKKCELNSHSKPGFTLVELLIVIVVIGVLSAMMIFSSTEAITTAKATKIVNDLNVIKKGVIAWYVDNYHRVTKKQESKNSTNIHAYNYMIDETYYLGTYVSSSTERKNEFLRYITNNNITLTKDNNARNAGDYFLATEGAEWYVGYNVGSDMRLRKKLEGRAKSAGLLGARKQQKNQTNTATIEMYDTTHDKVYMLIMNFE